MTPNVDLPLQHALDQLLLACSASAASGVRWPYQLAGCCHIVCHIHTKYILLPAKRLHVRSLQPVCSLAMSWTCCRLAPAGGGVWLYESVDYWYISM
jgi:hypothetical protein